jgi:hypothetical protein
MNATPENPMRRLTRCFVILSVLALATYPAWAGTGVGELTVTNDGLCSGTGYTCTHTPQKFNVLPGATVHINISAGISVCTVGANLGKRCDDQVAGYCDDIGNCPTTGRNAFKCSSNSPANAGQPCSTDADCSVTGVCAPAPLECPDGPTTIIVKGQDNNPCSQNSDCTAPGETGCNMVSQTCVNNVCSADGAECTQDSDCAPAGFCVIHDIVPVTVVNGQIDVCYVVKDMCSTATVAYCGDAGLLANATVPKGGQTKSASGLRFVGAGEGTCQGQGGDGSACAATDSACTTNLCPNGGTCQYDALVCQGGELEIPDCTNQVGSFCCGLTQGAYGAPNSVATATGRQCGNPDCTMSSLGFLPAAACQGCDALSGDPNAASIGNLAAGTPANSVRVGDLCTLIDFLPAGGPAASLTAGDHNYPPDSIPNLTGGGSKGTGGGVLSGQTMAAQLNTFLSNCTPPFGGSSSFIYTNFGGFTLPAAGVPVCTQRAGADKILGTDDDVFQAFTYPACVANLTVDQVVECANEQLAGGSNSCVCSASDLNVALSNINVKFDQCGEVVACPQNVAAGIYSGDPPHSGKCTAADVETVDVVKKLADETCAGVKNHGAYVSCVAKVAKQNSSGLTPYLPKGCRGNVVSCAAKSTVLTNGRVACCRTTAAGVTKCSIKFSAARCVAPAGGSACASTHASCCDACTSTRCAP